jgi:hypothetical protein
LLDWPIINKLQCRLAAGAWLLAVARSQKSVLCHLSFVIALALVVQTASCFERSDFERPDATIDFHGPDVQPGYPDAFSTDYVLPKDTVSPDGKYGLIFPDREFNDNPGRDFVVAFDPPQILTLLQTDQPEFEGRNHGGYAVEWSDDSSVALVTLDGKWGPSDFILLELQNGKVTRTTNLGTKIRQLLEPDYKKAKAEPYNDYYHFIFEDQDPVVPFCTLEKSALVRIDAFATSDPKSNQTWRARLRAVWDIRTARVTQQQVTRLSGRTRSQ